VTRCIATVGRAVGGAEATVKPLDGAGGGDGEGHRVTPALPSVMVGLVIDSVLESSFVIVPVPTAPVTTPVSEAGATAPSVTVKVSLASTMVSPTTSMMIVWVSPPCP